MREVISLNGMFFLATLLLWLAASVQPMPSLVIPVILVILEMVLIRFDP